MADRSKLHNRNADWIANRKVPKHQQWHGGKGSSNRISDTKSFQSNWDRIFGNKKESSDDE